MSEISLPFNSVPAVKTSRGLVITGYVLTGLTSAFLLFDGAVKLVKPQFVVEATTKLGFPESAIVPIGVVLVACTVLYLIPRTAILGAVLLTGYLGGAVETHVQASGSAFEILFPVVFGVLVWLGIYFREPRIRALMPARRV